MTGAPEEWDELVWRGAPENGAFMVFYLKDRRVLAVNAVNQGREMRAAQRLMASGNKVDPADLAKPEIRLLKLAKG